MTTTREKVIETTCDLIELKGHFATGLNQIVEQSGAPKGSLYYHFPDGKEEIVEEAVLLAGRRTSENIRRALETQAELPAALKNFIEQIADHIERSNFESGGPLTAVAMETAAGSPRINHACRQAFTMLKGAFQQSLRKAGFSKGRSQDLATFITASIEGGTILSRTYHTGDPLRTVAAELADKLKAELTG